ncbi:MAG: hypothetical protein NVS3B6_06140 [Pseudarthrobacter sp.]
MQRVGAKHAKTHIWEVRIMPGRFEIHRVGDDVYRFRLTDKNGNIVAVSPDFKHLGAVKDGIKALRENAATGIVVDLRHKPHPS